MSRPSFSRHNSPTSFIRVNHKIRAREVRVIGPNGNQLGIFPVHEALAMARSQGIDLVEVAANASPPVCRLVDYGKYRYEISKRDKESKRHQHANKVKEIQLSPSIDPHDLGVKLNHAIDFLCEEMKVKVTLRFRGREMAHKEFGFQTVERFLKELAAFGHPDSAPKLIGRGLNVMVSPLPRNKRAKHPRDSADAAPNSNPKQLNLGAAKTTPGAEPSTLKETVAVGREASDPSAFANNPFAQLQVKIGE